MEGQETKALTIKANIVERAIQILSMETEDPVDCVRFGDTYYGTDKTECGILFNNGPEPVSFVAILDEDAVAQEMVWLFFYLLLYVHS